MKISLKWVAELFEGLESDKLVAMAGELKTRLPLNGLEVGEVINPADAVKDVIVGQIMSFEKHPNADRLNVCKINDGKRADLQVVCGAPNVKVGVKVALAPVGAVLPGDFKIKQSNIRNVESNGMLCSEKELGLSQESQGIIHLPDSAPVGVPLAKALNMNDVTMELELTPDRADCLSHWGFAREISRWVGAKVKLPEIEALGTTGDVSLFSVEVKELKACPIYAAQLFENVQNGPSPDWLKRRLESLGARSHSLVVDLTNMVLLELGHPLHAFDADKIVGSKIIVRFARNGEKIKTLDGMERTLSADDLVIADLERPIALAGVMGGFDSGVSPGTTRVVLESAVFDAEVVRAMARRHHIHSDASHRFERGVDAAMYIKAAGRFAFLLKQLNSGVRRRGSCTEIRGPKAEKLFHIHSLNFDLRVFKDLIGLEPVAEDIAKAFQSVGIETQVKSPNVLKVDVPTHRLDLPREIDLVEEAARLLGYDRIPERYPVQSAAPLTAVTSLYPKLRHVRDLLLNCELTEVHPYCFISEKEKAWVPQTSLVELANPLSADWTWMRPNNTFGLLTVLQRHAGMGQLQGRFFDCGAVFEAEAKPEVPDEELRKQYFLGCKEHFHAAWALMGPRGTEHWSSDKKSAERKAHVDFYDGKGVAESMLTGLTVLEKRWAGTQYVALSEFPAAELAKQAPWIPTKLLHPFRSALLVWPGKPPGQVMGYVGELHPAIKAQQLNLATGLQLGAVIGEIRVFENYHVKPTLAYESPVGTIQLSRKLPVVERDFSMVVSDQVKAGELTKTLQRSVGPELLGVQCLDVYPMGNGKLSLMFRVHLQGLEKTLSDEEINGLVAKLLKAASEKHGAELRS